MKKIIILGSLILISLACRAQNTIPIENLVDYIGGENKGLADYNINYVKDINNLLDKYVGIWVGTTNNKNYEFRVTKYLDSFEGVYEDKLIIKYIISDISTNNILVNTTEIPDRYIAVIKGYYLSKVGTYHLWYSGNECGQSGQILIAVNANETEMNLTLVQMGDTVDSCVGVPIIQIMPLEPMTLYKQ